MVDINSPEMTMFNTARVPTDFNKSPLNNKEKRLPPWEIQERVPTTFENATPLLPLPVPMEVPTIDKSTDYFQISGQSRYIVEGNPNLGEGGASSVYKAWDKKLGKYVAVKKMQKNMDEIISDSVNWIELEAKTLARLSHPGLPEVYDFNMVDTPDGLKTPIMIMQLIEGGICMTDRMIRKNPFLNQKRCLELLGRQLV